jgi:hypothetical protein
LSVNNFGTPGDRNWYGDIGKAGTGKLAASGPGTLAGNINFAAPNTGQASISNTTIDGTVSYGVAPVQSTMNSLNALSANLGAMAASGLNAIINTSSDQTILASTGTSTSINGVNFNLFSVSSVTSNNGQNLIIKGDGSQSVVFDVNTPSAAQFHGNILLQDLAGKFFGDAGYAGLRPDQVVFNLWGGTSLQGGDKLDANNNGNASHPANIAPGGTASRARAHFSRPVEPSRIRGLDLSPLQGQLSN